MSRKKRFTIVISSQAYTKTLLEGDKKKKSYNLPNVKILLKLFAP